MSIYIFDKHLFLMSSYTVSALKYRPQSFDQVIGQELITSTLINSIKSNQIAQALLFCGPRGVGKTSCARILAKAINDNNNDLISSDYSFNVFELDAASNNGIEEIKRLNEQVRIPPRTGNYKVYIIDEAHMLSTSAFNAFLKTLEEPPKHAIFILATTEKNKIIPTILSRCQIYDFNLIPVDKIIAFLEKICKEKKVEYEKDALLIIAKKAEGAMRDALSILDKIISFTQGKITRAEVSKNLNVLDYEVYLNLTELIKKNDITGLILKYDQIMSKGYETKYFISGLANHIRELILCKDPKTVNLVKSNMETKSLFVKQSEMFPTTWLIEALNLIKKTELNHKASVNKRLNSELCLMQLASLQIIGEKKNW